MKYLIVSILFISTSLFGQEFNFDIQNTSLTEYLQLEQNLGGEPIPTTSNHISSSGNAQPMKFLRQEEVIPDLIVFYYFKEADSTMSHILYEWDISNFEKQSNNQKPKEFQEALIAKYEELKEMIAQEFGAPEIEKNYSNISRLDSVNTFEENSTWHPNDSTEIEMYATASNYYEKVGAMTINPVHRIRLYIKDQPKEKEVPKLDEQRLSKLESIKNDFLESLKVRDLSTAKTVLSDIVLETVTDKQLNLLIDNINFEKKSELIYSGIQAGFNQNMFTILQYRYLEDGSNSTGGMIRFIFDDKNKIVAVQPIQ